MTWQQLVSNHSKQLFRAAYRILHDAAEAEDITQEVLLEAYRHSQKSDQLPEIGLLSHMATIRAIDQLRRRKTPSPLDVNQHPVETPLSSSIEVDEQIAIMQAAIAALPDRQARCFALRHIEGMSNARIATYLEISESAVSTALYKARNNLRESLAHEFSENREA